MDSTVSWKRRALTVNIQLEGGLVLAHHVLGAAYDHPAIIVRREVQQDEAGLHF